MGNESMNDIFHSIVKSVPNVIIYHSELMISKPIFLVRNWLQNQLDEEVSGHPPLKIQDILSPSFVSLLARFLDFLAV